MNTNELVLWIKRLISENKIDLFYNNKLWKKKREKILKKDHYECLMCKEKGVLTKANIVHHINNLRDNPALALSKFYIDENGKIQRNLISVCFNCH